MVELNSVIILSTGWNYSVIILNTGWNAKYCLKFIVVKVSTGWNLFCDNSKAGWDLFCGSTRLEFII